AGGRRRAAGGSRGWMGGGGAGGRRAARRGHAAPAPGDDGPTRTRHGAGASLMSSLRPNPVREKLLRGEAVFGPMAFEFFTPGLLPILGQAGADFVILDMEHSGAGPDTIKVQLGAARGTGGGPIGG